MSEKISSSYESPEDPVELISGEWDKGGPGTILETGGLATCVAIATYDKERKIGHLAHMLPMQNENDEVLREFLGSVAESSDPSKLKVWLRGSGNLGQFSDDDSRLQSQTDRQIATDALTRMGVDPANVDTQWHSADEVMTVRLDCSTGEFATELFDLHDPDANPWGTDGNIYF